MNFTFLWPGLHVAADAAGRRRHARGWLRHVRAHWPAATLCTLRVRLAAGQVGHEVDVSEISAPLSSLAAVVDWFMKLPTGETRLQLASAGCRRL